MTTPELKQGFLSLPRRVLLWVASICMVALSVYGFVSNQLLAQTVWGPEGLPRFGTLAAIFVCAGLIFFWVGQRYFRGAFLLVAGLSIWAAVGAGALAGAVLCLLALLSIGDLILGKQRRRGDVTYDAGIAVAVGCAVFIGIFEYTARSRIHYSFVYLAVLVAAIAINLPGVKFWLQYAKAWLTRSSSFGPLEFALEVGAAFFLFYYLLLVLKPEIGADALSVHLALPAMMANDHRFSFDFHQYVWALSPLGSDWLFTLAYGVGGEFASRLLNFFFLCGLTFFLLGFVRESFSRVVSLLCVLLWLSTPMVELVTSSLFSENQVAFLSVAAFAALCAYRKTFRTRYLVALAALVGGGFASKFGYIGFFVPLIICVVWLSLNHIRPRARTSKKQKLATIALFIAIPCAIGAPSYVRAWEKTGNPVFPFMNRAFKSPYFPAITIDNRYHGTIDPRTFYAMTYKMGYMEGIKGSFGFEYLVLIPLVIIATRRSWPLTARMGLFVGVTFFFISISFIAYERYLYAGMPLILAGSAALFEDLRKGDKWLYRSLLSLGLLCVVLNAYFLPASGWYDKNAFIRPVHDDEDVRTYLAGNSPVREIIAYLDNKDPNTRVAFLAEPFITGLKGMAFTYNWYDLAFFNEIHQCFDAKAVAQHMAGNSIKYFIGHSAEQMESDTPALRAFVANYLTPDYAVSTSVLYRWRTLPVSCFGVKTPCAIPPPEPLAKPIPNPMRASTKLSAVPNPIVTAHGVGETSIVWSTKAQQVEIRVSTRNGGLLAVGGSEGSAQTGLWVTNGLKFYLQDHNAPDPTSEEATLGILTVTVH